MPPEDDKIEIGEYTTARGQVLSIYATYRQGGLNFYRTVVEPGWGFNLDVDGRGKLWFWPDWDKFIVEVNKLAGEEILTASDNPLVLDEELVAKEWGCPSCGERRVDLLVIDPNGTDENKIRCDSCGCVYWLKW